jgi:hypothetical protein
MFNLGHEACSAEWQVGWSPGRGDEIATVATGPIKLEKPGRLGGESNASE